jgi:ABC-type Na+ efflux pump permease subunit
MSHGFFEILQGNIPTGSLFISAIGEAQRMWPHGNEFAFTLVPNFLITGIAAMLVGLAIVVWSLCFVHKKNGPTILLALFVLLLLLGGGVAQVLFFPWIWLVSTRINKPLMWWRKVLPGKVQVLLGKVWLWCLTISSALLLFALAIAVTGFVPAVKDPDTALSVMLICLVIYAAALPLTFISGFAHDIATKPTID